LRATAVSIRYGKKKIFTLMISVTRRSFLSALREDSAAETAAVEAAVARNNATAMEIERARHAVPLRIVKEDINATTAPTTFP